MISLGLALGEGVEGEQLGFTETSTGCGYVVGELLVFRKNICCSIKQLENGICIIQSIFASLGLVMHIGKKMSKTT